MAEWKDDLGRLIAASARERKALRGGPPLVHAFLSDAVVPAFQELAEILREHGREVVVAQDDRSASVLITREGKEEFFYEVVIKAYGASAFTFPAIPLRDREGKTYRAEARIRTGPVQQDVTHASRSDVLHSFLRQYRRHLLWHL